MGEEVKTAITSPPCGTNNASGLGETFNINLSTGQAVFTYNIMLPEGVAKHTPKITLEYTHGGGHSPFGLGWRLSIRRISRRLDFGILTDKSIERYSDGGIDLLPLPDGTYAAQRETAFNRYSQKGEGWKIEERNGNVHELGLKQSARLSEPGKPHRIHEWLLERTLDPSNNAIEYDYLMDNGIAYLKEIRYAIYALRFTYENRPDPRLDSRAGYLRTRTKRCTQINLFIDPGQNEQRIRSWTLTYTQAKYSSVSMLTQIQMVSHGTAPNHPADVPRAPTKFKYTSFELQRSKAHWMKSSDTSSPPQLTDPNVALVTLDDAPLPGVLLVVNGKQYYWRNLGEWTWAAPQSIPKGPAMNSFSRSGLAFIDMDASGKADLLAAADESLPGYYENGGRGGWSRFVAFPRGRHATPFWGSGQVRLSDNNADGRIDAIMPIANSLAIWLNEGKKGWSEPLLVPRRQLDVLPDFSEPLVFLADVTGDGLDDLVRVRSGLVKFWPGLGYGRFGASRTIGNSPRLKGLTSSSTPLGHQPLFLIDVDGDGCADLVRVTATAVEVYINQNGLRFSEVISIKGIPPAYPGTIQSVNMRGHAGGGLVWNSPRGSRTGYVALEFSGEQPAYLLSQIENGTGLVSEIFYRSAVEDFNRDRKNGLSWNTHFPFPYVVVAGTKETDIVSGRITETKYSYHEAHFEPNSRQFQGFKKTERIEIGDESRSNTLTVFHFLMGQERIPGHGIEFAELNGMLRRVETYSNDNSPLQDRPYRIEETDYDVKVLHTTLYDRKHTFVYIKKHRIEDQDRTDDFRGEEKTYTYDSYGNVTIEVHRGYGRRNGTAESERLRTTNVTYAKSSTRYILGKAASITIRDDAGLILSEERRYYDGPDFIGLPIGQASRGLLTRKEQLVLNETDFNSHYAGMDAAQLGYTLGTNSNGVPALFASKEKYAYNAQGLKKADQDALCNQKDYGYDNDGLFQITLTSDLGITTFEYDRTVGQPVLITYPDGSQSRFAYDAQGRILAIALPGETLDNPPTVYAYNDASIPSSRTGLFHPTNDPANNAVAITYFDGRGREFQQRAQIAPAKFVVSGLRLLNPWGDLKEEYEPTFDTTHAFEIPPTTNRPKRQIRYDAVGRVTQITNFNGGVSTADYFPFKIITRDANDNDSSAENISRNQFNTPHIEEFDVLRHLIKTTERLSDNLDMTYFYTPSSTGDLLQINDKGGTLATYQYDQLGQRISIIHREAGRYRLWYDARGVIIRSVDAKGNDIRAEFDSRRRLIRLKQDDKTLEEYVYDEPNRRAFGRLSKVIYPHGSKDFEYDEKGRLSSVEYKHQNLSTAQKLTYTYDRLGRQTTVTHTDGLHSNFPINYELTKNGWIRAIPGFIKQVEYDPRGLPIQIEYQNGVVTKTSYTSGPGRVATQSTVGPHNQVLEDIKFDYDQMEILLSSNDVAPGGKGPREYAYDSLYQIISAKATKNHTPTIHKYMYTNYLNLSRFDEANSSLHYDDPLRQNRLTGLTPNQGQRFNLTYDNNGNMMTLPGKTFHFNAKNELVRFEATNGLKAEYTYDHKGNRLSKTVTATNGTVARTFFLDDLVEIRSGHPAYFIRIGSLRVAIVANGKTHFVHGDYLGSTAFFTNTSGTKTAAITYRPFGNVASFNGTIDWRTFGVHAFDSESGLYYMRRRYYAPEIGRFITPDLLTLYQPTMHIHNPKALHLYAFVANDPLNKTDPTGLSFWSVIGAIVGVIAAIAVAALVVMTGGLLGVVIGVALAIGLVAVSYVVANETAGTAFGEFMRGFMIGLNAGLNAIIATAIFGPVVGVTLGVINFLAAFDTIANNSVYQGILGWTSWLMPMSWLATGIGLVFFLLNVIPAIFTGNQVEAVKIHSLSIDWKTGTIVMEGGWTFLPGFSGGFNLGNFAYITPGSSVRDHETGHTLSVAAFGSIFHFIGAIDENAIQSTPANAYAERLADSHDPNASSDRATAGQKKIVPMWI